MRALFKSQDLWNLVETGYVKVKNQKEFGALEQDKKDALVETQTKDKKALYTNFQVVEELIFGKISYANLTNKAWDILQKSYKGDDQVRRVQFQTLWVDFESLCMNDLETISTYFDQVQSIVN